LGRAGGIIPQRSRARRVRLRVDSNLSVGPAWLFVPRYSYVTLSEEKGLPSWCLEDYSPSAEGE